MIDKGQSVGDRLATRRIGPGRADHGAQFFTVRSPEFKVWTEQWLAEGTIYQWSTGWSDGSLGPVASSDGYPRYAVHGGPAHSRQLWDETEASVLSTLQAALQPYLDPAVRIVEAQLKRWRYALPTTLHPDPCLWASGQAPLVFAGDAFGGPRIEGAAMSGLAAATAHAASIPTPQSQDEIG